MCKNYFTDNAVLLKKAIGQAKSGDVIILKDWFLVQCYNTNSTIFKTSGGILYRFPSI
jgi:hypothetical protein